MGFTIGGIAGGAALLASASLAIAAKVVRGAKLLGCKLVASFTGSGEERGIADDGGGTSVEFISGATEDIGGIGGTEGMPVEGIMGARGTISDDIWAISAGTGLAGYAANGTGVLSTTVPLAAISVALAGTSWMTVLLMITVFVSEGLKALYADNPAVPRSKPVPKVPKPPPPPPPC